MFEIMLFLIVIGTSVWVVSDASSLGVKKGLISGSCDYGPGGWFVLCLLLWIIAFPCYLFMRPKYIEALKFERLPPSKKKVKASAWGDPVAIWDKKKATGQEIKATPASILLTCESCKQQLEAPGDMVGEVVDCPKCKMAIMIEAPPDKKKCPFCAEEIRFEAIKCKFCGEMLNKA